VECPGSERAGFARAQPAHAPFSLAPFLGSPPALPPYSALSPFANGPRQLPSPEVYMTSSFWTLDQKGSLVWAAGGEGGGTPAAQLITCSSQA